METWGHRASRRIDPPEPKQNFSACSPMTSSSPIDNYFVDKPPDEYPMSYYSHTNRQQLIGQGEKPGRRKFCVDSEALFCIAHFPPKWKPWQLESSSHSFSHVGKS